MNPATSKRIKELLEASGLISNGKTEANDGFDCDFSNETILVTGAAGTIGSALARHVVHCKCKSIILIDNAESPLYYLEKELERHSKKDISFIVTDIRDEASMQEVFESFQPTVVFHTAAYKHVPLMESNAYEAVKLNIFGTKILADLAISNNAKKFIFISTDKAVNPVSVMGMTKRIAEKYLNDLNTQQKTSFLITRFGNVLGSNGSLIPVFKKQLDDGRPLTITSKTVSRYFININKASNLILKIASTASWNHHMFTFNMGEPIKIINLAKIFVSEYGPHKQKQLEIEIIGLRPGEKLHEDLVSNNETLIPTIHEDIFYVIPKKETKVLNLDLKSLQNITPSFKNHEIKSLLAELI